MTWSREPHTLEELQKLFVVFDNGGATFDRYTMIHTGTGSILGASDEPFSPQGFGQHCGEVQDSNLRRRFIDGIRVNPYENEIKDFSLLPPGVVQFMRQELSQ